VTGHLVHEGEVAPRAGVKGTLELNTATARRGKRWAAVPADHGVDGVHPGLQLLHVGGLEKILSSVTRLQPEDKLFLGVVSCNRGYAVVDPYSSHRRLVTRGQLSRLLVFEAIEYQVTEG